VSGRKDASNVFGVKANERWAPLWSGGARWLISSENFYRLKWLSYLQLRVTYGYSGNSDPSKTILTTLNIRGTNPYTNTTYGTIRSFPNPSLKWERVGIMNYGIDFKAFNQRLNGS